MEQNSAFLLSNSESQSFQCLRYTFHLFVPDENVSSVKILTEKPMSNGRITLSLERCSDDRRHWISPQLYVTPDHQDTFSYRYVVKFKEGMLKAAANFIVSTLTGRKEEKILQEKKSRKLNKGMHQYDIFHNSHFNRIIFQGQMYFVQMLYHQLTVHVLTDLLMECEYVGFGHPSYADGDVKCCLKWIQDAVRNSITPTQGLYICCVLGQLVDRGKFESGYLFGSLGRETVDLILSSFERLGNISLPKTSTRYIAIVAEDIFKASSWTGPLLCIKYFCNVLDIKSMMLVVDKLSSQPYIEQQFDEHASRVLYTLKHCEEPMKCKTYLSYLIQPCPSVKSLWELHSAMSHTFPDYVNHFSDEFLRMYSTFISISRARRPDLLQPWFWSKVPHILKEKVASPFCKRLAQQFALETKWSEEKIASLKTIILDTTFQSSDTFSQFISQVLLSKEKEMEFFLPNLLVSKTFLPYWLDRVSDDDKINFCDNCLLTNFYNGGATMKDKILSVVGTWKMLCETDAVKANKPLSEAVEKRVDRLVIRVNPETIMEAYKDSESDAIKQRLVMLLKSKLKQLSGAGNPRLKYKQMIHLLGFDLSKEKEKKDLSETKLDR